MGIEFICQVIPLSFDETFNNSLPHMYKSNGLEAKRREIYRLMINKFKMAYLNRTNFYEATFNIALTYQEMGKIDSAIIYYEKTVGINPNSVKVL